MQSNCDDALEVYKTMQGIQKGINSITTTYRFQINSVIINFLIKSMAVEQFKL
jgi:hypothetical protein